MNEATSGHWGDVIELKYGRALEGSRIDEGPVQVFGTNGPIGYTGELAQGPGPTVVIGRKGAYRGVHFASGPFWVIDTAFYIEPKVPMDMGWCYYALKNVDIDALGSGSAIPSTRREDLYAVPVRVPPVASQSAIANVLGALDDKIAANRRVVAAADRLGRLIAKKESAEGTDRMLLSVAELLTRGAAPKYTDHGYLVLNQKCVRNGRVDVSQGRKMLALPKAVEKTLCRGDILVNSTGQGTLGRVARWTRDDPGVSVDSHISIVRIDPLIADRDYIGTLLLGREAEIEALAEGTTGQTELGREALGALPLRLPTLEVQRRVGERLRSMASLMDAKEMENEVLAATRDELLPLLISGQITARDAEVRIEQEV